MSLNVNGGYFSDLINSNQDLQNINTQEVLIQANHIFKQIASSDRISNDNHHSWQLATELDSFIRIVNNVGLNSISNAVALEALNNIDLARNQVKNSMLVDRLHDAQNQILLHQEIEIPVSTDRQLERVGNLIQKEQSKALDLDSQYKEKINEFRKKRVKLHLATAGVALGGYGLFIGLVFVGLFPPVGLAIVISSLASLIPSAIYLYKNSSNSNQLMRQENFLLDNMRSLQKGKEAMNTQNFKKFALKHQFDNISDDQLPKFFEFYFISNKRSELLKQKHALELQNLPPNNRELRLSQYEIEKLDQKIQENGYFYYFPAQP